MIISSQSEIFYSKGIVFFLCLTVPGFTHLFANGLWANELKCHPEQLYIRSPYNGRSSDKRIKNTGHRETSSIQSFDVLLLSEKQKKFQKLGVKESEITMAGDEAIIHASENLKEFKVEGKTLVDLGENYEIDNRGWLKLEDGPFRKRLKKRFYPRTSPSVFLHVCNWGERRYLLYPSQIFDFCKAISSGQEPRNTLDGEFYLRSSDFGKAVKGLPEFPKTYCSTLLPILRAANEGNTKCVDTLSLLLSKNAAVIAGDKFIDSENDWLSLTSFKTLYDRSREKELFVGKQFNTIFLNARKKQFIERNIAENWFMNRNRGNVSGNTVVLTELLGSYTKSTDRHSLGEDRKSRLVNQTLRLFRSTGVFRFDFSQMLENPDPGFKVSNLSPRDTNGYMLINDNLLFLFKTSPARLSLKKAFDCMAVFNIVSWGERRYLIPDEQVVDFYHACITGEEPRRTVKGHFLMKCKDLSILPVGQPPKIEFFSKTASELECLLLDKKKFKEAIRELHDAYWKKANECDLDCLRSLSAMHEYMRNNQELNPCKRNETIDYRIMAPLEIGPY